MRAPAAGVRSFGRTLRFAPDLSVSYHALRAPVLRFEIRSAVAVMAKDGVFSFVRGHARGTDSALPIVLRR
jgi:hypothetical protein